MTGKNGTARFAVLRIAAGALISIGAAGTLFAQGQWNDPNWTAPRGYDDAYHEGGVPNAAARQGYQAGFGQGESDAREHHSFRPTHVDTYKNVPASPGDINRNDFKRIYREAFERGYARGYGR